MTNNMDDITGKQLPCCKIQKAKSSEFERIGELLYLVDPYIYPSLFGSPNIARKAMPILANIPNSPFSLDMINVAHIENEVVGILVAYQHTFAGMPDFSSFLESGLEIPTSSRDVCNNYLLPLCRNLTDDSVYIPCIATDIRYRGRGVASSLLRFIEEESAGKPLFLDVLKDNSNAIRLYERFGFKIYDEVKGYSFEGTAPAVLRMKT